ncbi:hypothetical protein VTL71DRAFT_3220 [Oculimacula yallundae]|uniref:NAD(P)-binding protein n=1 Tax=Oculimacula yallundae TaxID=86028 RepID=A0ABR4C6H2_9HELO
MSSIQNKLLITVTSGPLIGAAVSSLFISKGFNHVALISRNAIRLGEDVNLVLKKAKESGNKDVVVKSFVGDVSIPYKITTVLERIVLEFGAPEAVVYNAAVISMGGLGDFTEERLVQEFKVSTVGLYTTAKVIFPKLLERKLVPNSKSTLIVTGGGVYKSSLPTHLSLSLNKAAQFNLTENLTKTFEPQGVHVSVVVINKVITFDDHLANPARIAQEYWKMYKQEEDKWDRVIDMGYE